MIWELKVKLIILVQKYPSVSVLLDRYDQVGPKGELHSCIIGIRKYNMQVINNTYRFWNKTPVV